MDECAGECAGKFCAHVCGQIILRGLITAVVLVVDKLIVQRRELVIKRGRQMQRMLHIPECLTVFTEVDPGMPDSDIRMAGSFLGVPYFVALMVSLAAIRLRASPWSRWIWTWCIAVPFCMTILVWLWLIMSKRKRLCHLRSQADSKAEDISLKDRTLEEDISYIWTVMV